MATLPELESALRKADAAATSDPTNEDAVNAVRALSAEYQRVRSETNTPVSSASGVSQPAPDEDGGGYVKGRPINWTGMEPGAGISPEGARQVFSGIANMGIRGAPPAIGQAAGAALGPLAPVAVPVLGALGGAGGEAVAQLREGTFPRVGAMVGAGISNAVPGAPMANAGRMAVAKEMGKQAAGNLAGTVAETAIDERRLPSILEAGISTGAGAIGTGAAKILDAGERIAAINAAKSRNLVRDDVLLDAVKEGYVLAPTAINKRNPGAINSFLESVGGKAATNAEASLRNQDVTDRVAKRLLGIPENAPLVRSEPAMGIVGTTEKIRDANGAPYSEIKKVAEQAKSDLDILESKNRLTATNEHELNILNSDPKFVSERADLAMKAAADVEALKIARFEARQKFSQALSEGGDPKALSEAKKLMDKAEGLEDSIEEMAKKIGKPELVDQLKRARKTIAQSYMIDAALGHDGHVSAPILGRLLDKGIPLTDELRTIARFEQNYGRAMQEGGKTIAPTTSQMKVYAALTAAGLTGGLTKDPTAGVGAGALAALAMAKAPGAARSIAFSGPYQNTFLRPNYGTPMPDAVAQFARMATEAEGRGPNPLLQFLEKEYPRRQDQQNQRPVPYRQ